MPPLSSKILLTVVSHGLHRKSNFFMVFFCIYNHCPLRVIKIKINLVLSEVTTSGSFITSLAAGVDCCK
jgi:hypothetical protein